MTGETNNPRVVLQRLRTGRIGRDRDKEPKKAIYGLYHAAAKKYHPEAERSVRIVYLSTGEMQEAEMTDKQIERHLKKYEDVIAGIQRKSFPPYPEQFKCPSCAHYFICPTAED